MKIIISLLLILSLLTGCVPQNSETETYSSFDTTLSASENLMESQNTNTGIAEIRFSELSDPALLKYVEDSVYSDLITDLNNDSYFVENVSAIYISKEYLEEIAYNSQENIYFGYTLAELETQFQGTKYVFAIGEDGQTIVHEFEAYDDTYEKVFRNVLTGAGVILVCVTVATVSASLGAPAVSVIFAASAKTGTAFALSSSLFSGFTSGIVTGIQTKDFEQSLKAAAIEGSNGFKWGALTGILFGGIGKSIALRGATRKGLSLNQAARIQKESKYPLDVIKEFRIMEQYEISKRAGLTPARINGKTALVRKIDLKFKDELDRTNLERMQAGLAALDPDNTAYQLHHIGQKPDSTLAILTSAEHMQGGNNTIWHEFGVPSVVHGLGNTWNADREIFWKELAVLLSSGGL